MIVSGRTASQTSFMNTQPRGAAFPLALAFVCGAEALTAAEPSGQAAAPGFEAVVEAESPVYRFEPANNGAGPLWCGGSSCLVRAAGKVFASGIETLAAQKPLNNCRWLLFGLEGDRWKRLHADPVGLTREPSPLVAFHDGRFFLSANPTLAPGEYSGPARPEILEFDSHDPALPGSVTTPKWQGDPRFTEHSYRSFAADGARGEMILLQNIGYTHAEWTFRNQDGDWSASGRLTWPWGADYAKPEPIRVCYPNVALQDRAVHFCGVSDIIEPNPKWRAFKRELTGQQWDYDFRRLFYTWTPDITREAFRPWVEIASREDTCGWITPGDLWVDPDRRVHLVWSERALDERLRPRFFPEEKQSHAVNYAIIQEGHVVHRRCLMIAAEGDNVPIPSAPRFHIDTKGSLFVVLYVSGPNGTGGTLSENRVLALSERGTVAGSVTLPLAHPFTQFFTATVRAGSPPSDTLELLGHAPGLGNEVRYARIRLTAIQSER